MHSSPTCIVQVCVERYVRKRLTKGPLYTALPRIALLYTNLYNEEPDFYGGKPCTKDSLPFC